MCNHDANDSNTTIMIDTKKWFGVYPKRYKGICTCCKKNFTYSKKNGKYIEEK
jgi:hypothetical protein